MDIKKDWEANKEHFTAIFRTSLHVAVASIGEDNLPTTTPIGSLFLNDDQSGFYFKNSQVSCLYIPGSIIRYVCWE